MDTNKKINLNFNFLLNFLLQKFLFYFKDIQKQDKVIMNLKHTDFLLKLFEYNFFNLW